MESACRSHSSAALTGFRKRDSAHENGAGMCRAGNGYCCALRGQPPVWFALGSTARDVLNMYRQRHPSHWQYIIVSPHKHKPASAPSSLFEKVGQFLRSCAVRRPKGHVAIAPFEGTLKQWPLALANAPLQHGMTNSVADHERELEHDCAALARTCSL